MAASSSSKDKFFDNVIKPYLREVMQHPQAIQMHNGVLHICDVQGPKGTGPVEVKLEATEQEVFRCKGMVKRGLNANHLVIVDYTCDLMVDGKSMKDIIFSLNEKNNFLHRQIHDLQSQVFEYEARFKGLVLAHCLVRVVTVVPSGLVDSGVWLPDTWLLGNLLLIVLLRGTYHDYTAQTAVDICKDASSTNPTSALVAWMARTLEDLRLLVM
ncbi:40S ribosomal protein S5-1 [Hordeum vulgare]|nr:40S ribosomal protein S5-1 [Hordeum vulgare]